MIHYSWKQFLIALIGILSIVVVIQILQKPQEDIVCDKYGVFKESAIQGIIRSKLRDPNDHYKRTVIYDDILRGTQRLDLSLDFSDLFEVSSAGDTIRKASHSSMVYINDRSSFNVNFGYDCK